TATFTSATASRGTTWRTVLVAITSSSRTTRNDDIEAGTDGGGAKRSAKRPGAIARERPPSGPAGRQVPREPARGGRGALARRSPAASGPGRMIGLPPRQEIRHERETRHPGNRLRPCAGRLRGRCTARSEEHTSELQSRENLVCRLLLEKKNARQQ